MNLEIVLAEYVLGYVDSYDLPKIAAEAVAAGIGTVELAALVRPTRDEHPSDLREGFERAISAAGLELPTRRDAALIVRQHIASQALDRALAPLAGAARLRELQDHVDDLFPSRKHAGDGFGIDSIISLYWQADELSSRAELGLAVSDAERDRIESELLCELEKLASRNRDDGR